jgi:hypothetical protein
MKYQGEPLLAGTSTGGEAPPFLGIKHTSYMIKKIEFLYSCPVA